MLEDSAENFAQGQDRYLSHEYDAAISYFQKSVKDPRYKTESLFYIGLCYVGLGHYELAVQQYDLTASMIRDPEDPLAKKLKRQLYLLSEGRNEEDAALRRYQQLLDLGRAATVDAGRALAHAQERYVTEQYEEAIVLFQAATREPRQRVESLYYMGLCFRELQSYKMAIEKLREALRLAADPESPLARKVRRELKQLEGDAWA